VNVPNKLSMVRILIVPVILVFLLPVDIFSFVPASWNSFVLSNGRVVAGVLFLLASITDYLDGQIARKYDLITNLGKFLDALADKMLVISVLVALVSLNRISSVFVIIIILREFMVTGIRMLASEKGVVMAAKMIGKVKTVTQMIAITVFLFEPLLISLFARGNEVIEKVIYYSGDVCFYICVLMTILSGMDYLVKNLNYLKES